MIGHILSIGNRVRQTTNDACVLLFLSLSIPHNPVVSSFLNFHHTPLTTLHTMTNQVTTQQQENTQNTRDTTMPESTSPILPTNTLIITNLEVPHFEKETMLKLKTTAESFGDIFYFAPIKSFYRVFVVYKATFDAQRAKAALHNTTFEGSTIRVYFGQVSFLSLDSMSDMSVFHWSKTNESCSDVWLKSTIIAHGDGHRSCISLPAPPRARKELAHLSTRLTPNRMVPSPRRPSQLPAPGRRSRKGFARHGPACLPTPKT